MLAEVNNTFGEHHNYLLRIADGEPLGDGAGIARRQGVPRLAVHARSRAATASASSVERSASRLARIDYDDADGDLLLTAISGQRAGRG